MFLSKKLKNGVPHLMLIQSTHVPGKKYPKKTVKKDYGPYDQAPEELRKKYESDKAKKAVNKQLTQEKNNHELLIALRKATADNSQDGGDKPQSNHFNKSLPLTYGHLAFKGIWEDDLSMSYKLNYLQKNHTNVTAWKLDDLLFYLCVKKILAPSSYLGASESKGDYLYCPWNAVAQDNFYRALDIVYDHRESLIKHAVKNHLKKTNTEVRIAFFDCTNTWFETPYDDIVWQTIRFARERRAQLVKAGATEKEIEEHLASGSFAQDLQDELEEHQGEVLRMRGKSKEGRFSQPIVTVALAIDQTGFPIDVKVFAGNLSELKTIAPVLESLKEKYAVKDIYFVADRGLNSAESLDLIRQEQMGFVVAQKVSKQTAQTRAEMLDLKGYRNCSLDTDGLFQTSKASECQSDAYRYKTCTCKKVAYVRTEGQSKRHKITVDCKVIYTFSPERRKRDLAELDIAIAKAKKAVADGLLMGNANTTGWRALVKTAKENAQSKEDKEQYRAQGIKQSVIDERKQIAGYAAVVFSHPDGKEVSQLSDEQVLTTYHRLVNIERCFRIMKSNFSIRPVHVRLQQRIVAHCYLCTLALMMIRTLQLKLKAKGIGMTEDRISQALSQARVAALPVGNGAEQLFLNLGESPRFHEAKRLGKGGIEWDLNDVIDSDTVWKRFAEERNKCADDTDRIFEAVNLRPLDLCTALGDIKSRLGLKTVPLNVMVAPEHSNYAQAAGNLSTP